MIILNEWGNKALEKLEKEKGAVTGQKETAMKGAVLETIKDFCRQDAEFAPAVVQGGTFKDCMTAVAKGVGRSISDIEAYRKAVTFYFDGATVRFEMRVQLEPVAEEDAAKTAAESGCILLSLDDFM